MAGKAMSAGTGAVSGAASGALVGSAVPGIGTAAGALGGAVLGGVSGWLSGSDGPQQAAPVYVDPNDPNFSLNGAGINEMRGMGASTAARVAPTTNYDQANADYARQLQARDLQMAEVARLQGMLNGTGPVTEAQLQLQAGNRDAASLGQQMAASARGTGALMLQRQALNAAVVGSARTNEQAAFLRAREEAEARAQLQGMASNIRGGDMGSRAESAGQSQFLTNAELQNRAQNDKASLGYYGLASQEGQAQLGANIQIAQGNQNAGNGVSQYNANQRAAADAANGQAFAGMMGGLGSAAVGVAGAKKTPTPGAPAGGTGGAAPVGLTPDDYAPFPNGGTTYAPTTPYDGFSDPQAGGSPAPGGEKQPAPYTPGYDPNDPMKGKNGKGIY